MYHQQTHTSQQLMFLSLREQLIVVRPATAADTFLLADMLGRLSERTRYLRFMRSGYFSAETIWNEAMRMAQGHSFDHMTLVATIRPKKSDEAIAVAELVRDQHELTVGEIALVVRDDQQRQGIGSFLLWQLIYLAQRSGITGLSARMAAENKAMLHLICAQNLPYTTTTCYGETQVLLQVPRSLRRPPPQRINNNELLDESSSKIATLQLTRLLERSSRL